MEPEGSQVAEDDVGALLELLQVAVRVDEEGPTAPFFSDSGIWGEVESLE